LRSYVFSTGSCRKCERRRSLPSSNEGLTQVTICWIAPGATRGHSLRVCSRLRTSRAVIRVWKRPLREKTTMASSMVEMNSGGHHVKTQASQRPEPPATLLGTRHRRAATDSFGVPGGWSRDDADGLLWQQ